MNNTLIFHEVFASPSFEEKNSSTFFEGAEKTFTITFSSLPSLLSVTKEKWQVLLTHAKCQILSVLSNSFLNAFILSESSLFVWRDKLLIKTCGKTNLIAFFSNLINTPLNFFDKAWSREKLKSFVQQVRFSRPFYIKPEDQPENHRTFENESQSIREIVKESIEKEDPQFYETNINNKWFSLTYEKEEGKKINQEILETAFYGLAEEFAAVYFNTKDINVILNQLHLKELFPEFALDYFIFDPCGFSANGIKDSFYYTIHVTPEKGFSYFSLETNFLNDGEVGNKLREIIKAEEKLGVYLN